MLAFVCLRAWRERGRGGHGGWNTLNTRTPLFFLTHTHVTRTAVPSVHMTRERTGGNQKTPQSKSENTQKKEQRSIRNQTASK